MLEKFSKKDKNFLFDAHFHYAVCREHGLDIPVSEDGLQWTGISCAHSTEEYEVQSKAPQSVIQSYGMHPQNAAYENIKESADFLESLLRENKLSFIGEAGFDYFSQEFRNAALLQEEIWNIQLDLALKYNLPLVVHCRKANEKLFEYSKQLKKLPEVLFHSFMGMPAEALSLCRRGINAYFSFGKQVMNGNKKVIACVRELPDQVLLTETDAPFQYLKGENYTAPSDIEKIRDAFIDLRSQS